MGSIKADNPYLTHPLHKERKRAFSRYFFPASLMTRDGWERQSHKGKVIYTLLTCFNLIKDA